MAGKLVHFELPSSDTARARDFWSGLFGWKFSSWEEPVEYHMTEGMEPVGAIFRAEQTRPGNLIAYFDTDDIDGSLGRVRELGGEADEKQPIPGIGWFARCKDSEGNAFSLYQNDSSAGVG